MGCCINCFESIYIKEIIINKKAQLGKCEFCLSENVDICDPSELGLFFKGVIDLYDLDESGKSLDVILREDFNEKVFTKLVYNNNMTLSLISQIIADDIQDYEHLLKGNVSLKYKDSKFKSDVEPLTISWENFTEEIKFKNRFHFENSLNLNKLKELFKNYEKTVSKGVKYYRARVCDSPKGFEKKEMGHPPSNLAKSGRANPQGISYLYLGDSIDTTLYEARVTLLDYVSIGTFRLMDDIKVVNLSRETYDIFRLAEIEALENVLKYSSFIDELELSLSKPKRRTDSELDYLPTQYISELIKSMGYDGIEYRSSLFPSGHNLAIFNTHKFECIKVDVYDITWTKMNHSKI